MRVRTATPGPIRSMSRRMAKKIKMCHGEDCVRRVSWFAHDKNALCPTCDKAGAGHEIGGCLKEKNKSGKFVGGKNSS
jgi:hypothetical protein